MSSHNNQNLNKAKWLKKDEFYTDMADIEFAMPYYKEWLKGRMVYLNCDDPTVSSFYKYFTRLDSMFEYQLKELAVTYFISQQADLFDDKPPLKPLITGITKDGLYVDRLKGDGSFDSPECLELLKRADVVITNPPFSLLLDYIKQLKQYDKEFLIIGNMAAASCKDIFEWMRAGELKFGHSRVSADMLFNISLSFAKQQLEATKRRSACVIKDGVVMMRAQANWITNLDIKIPRSKLNLTEQYHPDKYPRYDNYDAIEVSKVSLIPKDYDGEIGVPINFFEYYNPDKFELVGIDRDLIRRKTGKGYRFKLAGKTLFVRFVIIHKFPQNRS